MNDELIELNGKFTCILFLNEKNFYTVSKFIVPDDSSKNITVVGILPNIRLNEMYCIKGRYVEHPRFGMQFKAETFALLPPSGKDGIIRYLSSAQFPGVGRKSAEKIAEVMGEECLDILQENPSSIRTVPGLSDKVMDSIEQNMTRSDGLQELAQFLTVNQIGIHNLTPLNAAYGSDAMDKIRENPYRVVEECDGIGFVTADKMGVALGIEKGDKRRLYAYLIALVSKLSMDSGDSYVLYDDLKDIWHKKTLAYDDCLDDLILTAVLKRSLYKENEKIYSKSQYDAEVTIASFLAHFPARDLEKCDMDLVHQYLQAMEEENGISYDELQVKAIDSFFTSPLSIITGGPGTGKTTVVRAFLKLFRMMYPNATAVCAAPTGRAAKRLSEVTGTASTTIHSLLKWDLESNTFGKNENEPVDVDLLIIDEFSMVDAYVFSALCKAGAQIRKICLIGDEDQLPSVGPGCVLRDLIASNLFPLVRLQHIYRQKNGSEIISLAHEIGTGTVDFENYSHDVHFIEAPEVRVKDIVLDCVQESLQNGCSMDEIQVLSPMYRGGAGIDVLNNALQEAFNPPSAQRREIHYGYRTFRENDKILQLKNQPDDDVYNGDIGFLEEIEFADETDDHKQALYVSFQDNIVCYQPENFDKITHAYCISVHKSQGGEYPVVIMPFVQGHTGMLYRKLIYTACSRARRTLYLIGSKDIFLSGIARAEKHIRATGLTERLQSMEVYFDKW